MCGSKEFPCLRICSREHWKSSRSRWHEVPPKARKMVFESWFYTLKNRNSCFKICKFQNLHEKLTFIVKTHLWSTGSQDPLRNWSGRCRQKRAHSHTAASIVLSLPLTLSVNDRDYLCTLSGPIRCSGLLFITIILRPRHGSTVHGVVALLAKWNC